MLLDRCDILIMKKGNLSLFPQTLFTKHAIINRFFSILVIYAEEHKNHSHRVYTNFICRGIKYTNEKR